MKEGGVFFVVDSNLALRKGSILECFSEEDGGAIYVKKGNLNISERFFSSLCSAREGGFLFVDQGSSIFLNNSNIFFTSSFDRGAVLLLLFCELFTMQQSLLVENGKNSEFGLIYIENDLIGAFTLFSNCTISNNKISFGSFLIYRSLGSFLGEHLDLLNNVGSLIYFAENETPDNNRFTFVKLFSCVIHSSTSNNISSNTIITFEKTNVVMIFVIFSGISFHENAIEMLNCFGSLQQIIFFHGKVFEKKFFSSSSS